MEVGGRLFWGDSEGTQLNLLRFGAFMHERVTVLVLVIILGLFFAVGSLKNRGLEVELP